MEKLSLLTSCTLESSLEQGKVFPLGCFAKLVKLLWNGLELRSYAEKFLFKFGGVIEVGRFPHEGGEIPNLANRRDVHGAVPSDEV
jgi:hypothetical protein